MKVSTTVRLDEADDRFGVGLALLETDDQFTTLRLKPDGARLATDASSWTTSGQSASFEPEPGTSYRLTLRMSDNGRVTGTVAQARGGRVLSELSGASDLDPVALGLHVHLPAEGTTQAVFDEVEVQSAPYRVKTGEWVRSRNFVVLPRQPDVGLDQGNWVGAPSVIREGDSLRMWYRIRSNESRGVGYGHASSQGGVHWRKSDRNPLFKHGPSYQSNEKMAVLKVGGEYRAWYTVDTGDNWVIAYATSPDGLKWKKHGRVIDQTYAKDPTVVHVDGTYYLYAISPTGTDLSVFTSSNGMDWTRRDVIPTQDHRHPGAYYVEETETFWLYAFGGANGVSRASSGDGIHFGPLKRTWGPPAVGLDDWSSYGIDYGGFVTNPRGHMRSDQNLYMYYQARNTFGNNIPGWRYHGGERVVLAGRFHGLHKGIPTTIRPTGTLTYHAFPRPMTGTQVPLSIESDEPVQAMIDRWSTTSDTLGAGTLTPTSPEEANVQFLISDVRADNVEYHLVVDSDKIDQQKPTNDGTVVLNATLSGSDEHDFRVVIIPRDE